MSALSTTQKIYDQAKASVQQRAKLRESFQLEAIDAWREYRETSLHLTNNETKTWLRGWGTEAETEIPKCHNSSLFNQLLG